MYCQNCNEFGHIQKHCRFPKTSYGIIAYTLPSTLDGGGGEGETAIDAEEAEERSPHYLMIQRKYSYCYVELMCGHFENLTDRRIPNLISRLPPMERDLLQHCDFSYLWRKMWEFSFRNPYYAKKYEDASLKMKMLKPHLMELYRKYPCMNRSPEWGFPKGRRNPFERDSATAHREFLEETGFSPEDYLICEEVEPLIEEYRADDGQLYRHVYYLARAHPRAALVSPHNLTQNSEISQIGWFTLEQASGLLKTHQKDRLDILQRIDAYLKK